MPLRRSNRIQNKTGKSPNISVIEITGSSHTVRGKKRSRKTPNRARQKRSRPSSTARCASRSQPRPITISLDVTDSESSYSDSDSDVEEVIPPSPPKISIVSKKSSKRKVSDKNENLWPTVRTEDGRCVPDSDSGSNDAVVIPNHKHYFDALADSGSEDDLYSVNHQEQESKTLEAVKEELKLSKCRRSDNDKFNLFDGQLTPSPKKSKTTNLEDIVASHPEAPETQLLNLDNIDVSSIVLKHSGKKKKNKKLKNAIASLEALSQRLQNVQSCDNSMLDVSDDIIMADKSDLTIRIRWGTEYIRHTMNKDSKFASMYQELAETHKVSVSQVLLSFENKVISPDERPSDLRLTLGDIIEGGILSKNRSESNEQDASRLNDGEDSISLKVQTANRKVVHILRTNKYDKLSLLMDDYAKLRNLPREKFKFKFDGDILQPSETPADLDLEGGECIDAFEF